MRYTGTSLAFNFAGILGASLAPYLANRLASELGVGFVGLYLSAAGLVSLVALLMMGDSNNRGVRPARIGVRNGNA